MAQTWTSGFCSLRNRPDAHERAGGAEPGDEVGDLGHVAPDLGAGALVVGPGVGLVAVLEREPPVGVLGGHGLGPAHGAVGALATRRRDDLGAPHLEQLAPLDRDVLGQDDLEVVAAGAGDHRQGDAGVARGRLEDHLARAGREDAVLLGLPRSCTWRPGPSPSRPGSGPRAWRRSGRSGWATARRRRPSACCRSGRGSSRRACVAVGRSLARIPSGSVGILRRPTGRRPPAPRRWRRRRCGSCAGPAPRRAGTR